MSFRRFRRKVRCMLKHGPRGCPHIERHGRRPRRPVPDPPSRVPPLGRHSRD